MTLLLGVMLATGFSTPLAGAFPKTPAQTGCHSSVQYEFDSSVPSTIRDVTRAGFEKWNNLRDRHGNRQVSVEEVGHGGSGPIILISIEDIPAAGRASCSGQTIKFDSTNFTSHGTWHYRNVATHEMGHILGLPHTGASDSRDGVWPNMNTCATYSAQNPSTRASDDQGQLDYRQGTQSAITANAGFENGRRHWKRPGSGAWHNSGSSPQYGNNKIRYRGTGATGHMIYQEGSYAGSTGQQIYARAALRRENSSHIGTVQVRLAIRAVT